MYTHIEYKGPSGTRTKKMTLNVARDFLPNKISLSLSLFLRCKRGVWCVSQLAMEEKKEQVKSEEIYK